MGMATARPASTPATRSLITRQAASALGTRRPADRPPERSSGGSPGGSRSWGVPCQPRPGTRKGVKSSRLAPGRRVLVARTDTRLPFNIADESALLYGLTVQESRDSKFSERLKEQILRASPVVRPVLETSRISPSEGALRRQVERAETLPALIAVWEDWKSYSSVSVDSLLQLANSFSRQNRLDLAIDVLRRAYAEAPNDWEVARTLGWCLRWAGRLEESEKLLLQALWRCPGRPSPARTWRARSSGPGRTARRPCPARG